MSAPDVLPTLLVSVPAVILACHGMGALARRFGQPPVIGEIVTGILLGPALLGLLWPQAQTWLFSAAVSPFIEVLGQLGLLCFMFLVGLELNLKSLRGHGRTVVAVSQAGILLPLALGGLLAVAIYDTLAPPGVGKVPFVLFIAVSMSVTAFPVLAAILTERTLVRKRVGALAMACAAVDDVTAWCLLAVVVAVLNSSSPAEALVTAALTVGFVLVMRFTVRPLMTRTASSLARRDRVGTGPDALVMVIIFSGLCLASLTTHWIGMHALFGAFLFGVMLPRDSAVIDRSASRLRMVVVPLLLPLFFVSTGMKVNIGVLTSDPLLWLWTAAIVTVAVVGKWGGCTLAARACGESWRTSLFLGALMNCRGLTELVVLNVGFELGVLSSELFTMLVLMALITTAATSPALNLITRTTRLQHSIDPCPQRPHSDQLRVTPCAVPSTSVEPDLRHDGEPALRHFPHAR